jgi:hypothetical protein
VVANTTPDRNRHVDRHSNLLNDRALVLDDHDLWLRWLWRLRQRFLNHRWCFDRPLASAANDRFDHFLAEPSLLQLRERGRIDVEDAAIDFDQRQQHLVAEARSLEIDEVLQCHGFGRRCAEREDNRSGSNEAAKHEQSPVEVAKVY